MKPWLKWLLVGAVSVIAGFIVLGNTVAASLAITLMTGGVFAAVGVFQIVAGLSEEGAANKLLSIILGVLVAFVGVSFLFNPLEGTISLALLVTILIGAGGALRLFLARQMKETQFFWPMLGSGALSILLAIYILANFAAASVSLLGVLMGIELVFNGASFIVLAFFLRRTENQA